MQILLTREQLQMRVEELAGELNRRYGAEELTIVGVMSGCVVFLADIIRHLSMPVRIEFLKASSYRGEVTRPDQLQLTADDLSRLQGRHVLVIDDIFDTGRTLQGILNLLATHEPRSLRTLVLLWKQERNETDLIPDQFGFVIPDKFVVGYGLDYDGLYRNLPDVCWVE